MLKCIRCAGYDAASHFGWGHTTPRHNSKPAQATTPRRAQPGGTRSRGSTARPSSIRDGGTHRLRPNVTRIRGAGFNFSSCPDTTRTRATHSGNGAHARSPIPQRGSRRHLDTDQDDNTGHLHDQQDPSDPLGITAVVRLATSLARTTPESGSSGQHGSVYTTESPLG